MKAIGDQWIGNQGFFYWFGIAFGVVIFLATGIAVIWGCYKGVMLLLVRVRGAGTMVTKFGLATAMILPGLGVVLSIVVTCVFVWVGI